ncbi:hypothetical protein FBQ87_16070 [Sphingobacteriales bacterium CHB3]|nr:hypothetical protein [Sphingobacteriales bacterium CHB3]
MFFIRRNPVTVTVYVASQGNDIYMSYRTFLQSDFMQGRVAIVTVIGALIGFALGETILRFLLWDWSEFPRLFAFIGGGGVVAILIVAMLGLIYHRGDAGYFFRQPLHELVIDDAQALTLLVQRSLLTAAEVADIKLNTLEKQEPFAVPRNRPKLRF